jgi:Protein of unknown function (DUF3108)
MSAGRLERGTLATLLLVAGAWARAASLQPPSQPTPFVATYSIAWHGITAGTSTLTLRSSGPQSYLYTSTDRAYGIFRVAFPHPLRQSSRFTVISGRVEPLTFQAGGGGNEVMAQFDWKDGHVTGMAKGKLLDLKLQPGTQDPLSVQIAIMLELQAQAAPESFWMLNTDEIDRYEYRRHEAVTLDTPLGKLATILYTSHAAGSNKTTYLWLAPALHYMPARAEQHVKGSTQVALEIQAFKAQ